MNITEKLQEIIFMKSEDNIPSYSSEFIDQQDISFLVSTIEQLLEKNEKQSNLHFSLIDKHEKVRADLQHRNDLNEQQQKRIYELEKTLKEVSEQHKVGFAPEYVLKRYAEHAAQMLGKPSFEEQVRLAKISAGVDPDA